MAKYIIKRILAAIPMVLIITVICFALMNLAPYDAIDAMTTPNMSPETVALIKAKYGYDQPVYIQYIRWLDGYPSEHFSGSRNPYSEYDQIDPSGLSAGLCTGNCAGADRRFS